MPFDALNHSSKQLQGDERLTLLGAPQRVWAVGSLYGRYGAVCQLHEVLARRLKPRDRLVYMGNYLGTHGVWTGEGQALIEELVNFRNAYIAIPGFFADDFVFLKGPREDLLQQLLRLPFQRHPERWLGHAMQRGLEGYIVAYGGLDTLYSIINEGLITLNKWTHNFRESVRAQPGHEAFFDHLSSCAATRYLHTDKQIGLVPAGLDPIMPLALQYDELIWPARDIRTLTSATGFSRIIRGQSFTPNLKPAQDNRNFVFDLDGGDGLEGRIYAGCFDAQGHLLDMVSF